VLTSPPASSTAFPRPGPLIPGIGTAAGPGHAKEPQDLIVGEVAEIPFLAQHHPQGKLRIVRCGEPHLHETNTAERKNSARGPPDDRQHPLPAIGRVTKSSTLCPNPSPVIDGTLHDHTSRGRAMPLVPDGGFFLPPRSCLPGRTTWVLPLRSRLPTGGRGLHGGASRIFRGTLS
jgi:hypothetical protein